MRYRLLHNLDGFDPYTEGDPLADGFAGDFDAESLLPFTMTGACDVIFARHNRDDRPDGKTAPSLSVGDVIYFPLVDLAYAVESVGFREVDVFTVNDSRTFKPYLDSL